MSEVQLDQLDILVNQKPGTIKTNFIELKKALSEQMEVYKALEVTEANKPERKKDIASLRKMEKSIDAKKSEVRNLCLVPYDAFVKQADDLKLLIAEPIKTINNQVQVFEEKQRLDKIKKINEIFDGLVGELAEEIGILEIYDNRWENVNVSMKSIKEEITVKLDTIRNNVALIKSMASDKTEEALNLFWGDLDVNKAIAMINRYEAQKRQIEQKLIEKQRKEKELEAERERMAKERELERERERVRAEERAKIKEEERIREEVRKKAADEEARIRDEERQKALAEEKRIREEERLVTEKKLMGIKEPDPVEDDDLEAPFTVDECFEAKFKVRGSMEELRQVEMYLNSIGVWFERWDVDGKR